MARLRLRCATGLYLDRTIALQLGLVRPEGIDLDYTASRDLGSVFRAVRDHATFDVAEFSAAWFLKMISGGDHRYVAIPVFLSRAFRHSYIFVPVDSEITRPEQLRGADVGIADYHMTAALWARAFLEHDYGVSPRDVNWWQGALRRGGTSEPGQTPPAGVRVRAIDESRALEPMLEERALDALVTAEVPEGLRTKPARIRRLFEDARRVEREYFDRTGLFPIMHLVVIRRAVYEGNPWIARALFDAFGRAKRWGRERLHENPLAVGLPWLLHDLAEIEQQFGGDAFAYGFRANEKTLDAMIAYAHEQGILDRGGVTAASVFAPETID